MKKTFQLCFYGSGKYSELCPEELEFDEAIVEDLVNQALYILPLVTFTSKVEIGFLPTENVFAIRITICYYNKVSKSSSDGDDVEASIEGVVSKALLQIFSEIAVVECPYLSSI